MSLPPAAGPVVAAESGLRYATDREPGIRRKRWGRGFTYLDPDGQRITDRAERRRLKALAVPPAWTDVWISPDPDGHLQATGRDAKGRKQYRYHPDWHAARLRLRYDQLVDFSAGLPALRRAVGRLLVREVPTRDVVIAVAVYLLDRALLRVGHACYTRENGSFGVSTLEARHVSIDRTRATFTYAAKSGRERTVRVDDPRVSRILRQCASLPGQRLLTWRGLDGDVQQVDSRDINRFIQQHAGDDFSAKDFRTWGGTVAAYEVLSAVEPPPDERAQRSALLEAMRVVAGRLGNTVAVCRRHYVHPRVLDAWRAGQLVVDGQGLIGLTRSEQAVAALLAAPPAVEAPRRAA